MSKPNILYIHSHDTGRFVQPYGVPFDTPNLAGLAKTGVTFRHAFCAASSCSAARSAVLTGMYPHQNGMTGLGHRGWYLYDYQKTLITVLKKAGYHTALMGESHITPRDEPELIGFDEICADDSTPTAEITDTATKWLEQPPTEPWFLSCGFWDTHRSNYPKPTKSQSAYGSVMPVYPDKPELRADFAAFQGAVERLDGGIGKVLEALQRSGQAENTIIIATTDHAPGFPMYKANVSDKGLGVFLIISGPGIVSESVYEPIVSHLDIFPTLCQLADINQPDWLEGDSLVPILSGKSTEPIHTATFGESNYHAAYEPQRSMRTDRYRYYERYDNRTKPVLPNVDESPTKDFWLSTKPSVAPKYLFDIRNDPLERINLAGNPAHKKVEEDLAAQLTAWRQAVKDPLLLDGTIPFPKGAQANDPDQAHPGTSTHLL